MAAVKARRTQAERREGTIRKLLDAAADALIDTGYAAASVQAICERAGVSQGALFRHFPTREALMVAVGEDVGRRTLERYRKDFLALRGKEDALPLALRLVRATCRSRLNQAWYELAMAARTSPRLRRGIRPVAERYFADIEGVARELLPDPASTLGAAFPLFVQTMIAIFDGESVHDFILPSPQADEARLLLLLKLAEHALRPA